MILNSKTFEVFGYNPINLSRGSKRLVYWKCEQCNLEGKRIFRDCRKVCGKCRIQNTAFGRRKIPKIYCCISCGYKISSQSALKGFGNCIKCYRLIRNKNKKIIFCKKCNKIVCNHGKNKICSNCYLKSLRGKNNPNWNKNLTNKERLIRRNVITNELWIKNIFRRDNYTCQSCFQRGNKLVAHHLEGYHWCKELRFEESNGVTLCEKCHNIFHKIYTNFWNTTLQYLEYINGKRS